MEMDHGRMPWSYMRDGEQKALNAWMHISRFVFGVLLFPKPVLQYFLVLARVIAPPAPALELAKANYDMRKGKLAKKIGMGAQKKIEKELEEFDNA